MGTIDSKGVNTRKNDCLGCAIRDKIIDQTENSLSNERNWSEIQSKALALEEERSEKYRKLYVKLKKKVRYR